ncbi:hypothetical protein OC835_006681 [Tilletia horrida]|nr:hypothetical protein OC835_006681 [Tilletia horrida]
MSVSQSPVPPVIDLANSPSNSPSLIPASSAATATSDAESSAASQSSTPTTAPTSVSHHEDTAQAAELRKEIISMLLPNIVSVGGRVSEKHQRQLPKINPGDPAFSYSRQLPVTLLYDERGLKIYDRLINEAGDYYLFNAELQILRDHSPEIVRRMLAPQKHHQREPQNDQDDRNHLPPQHNDASSAQEKDVWGSSRVGTHNDGVNGQHSLRSSALADLSSATPGGSATSTNTLTANSAAPAVVELGAGSLRKTVHLLRAFGQVWGTEIHGDNNQNNSNNKTFDALKYYALDLSRAELDRTLGELVQQEQGVERVARDGKVESHLYNGALSVNGIWGDYNQGLKFIGNNGLAPAKTADPDAPQTEGKRIFLWLGSSIGNFSPRSGAAGFLRDALCGGNDADGKPAMRPGDYLLIGLDRRNEPSLVARAYHDSLGITEEFILNGLEHADRVLRAGTELDGDAHAGSVIDVGKFAYHDRYAEPEGRHESYYRSLERQVIRIPPLIPDDADVLEGLNSATQTPAATSQNERSEWTEVVLDKDELIHVEVSIKYSPAERAALFQAAGLREVQSWTDNSGRYDVVLVERPPFVFGATDTLPKETLLDVLALPNASADGEASQEQEQKQASKTAAETNPYGLPTWAEWEKTWQAWDTVTLGMIPREMLFEKPIDLRHICLFYLGHIPAFLDIQLSRYLQEPDTNKWFSCIFERGIDPQMDDPSQCHSHSEVPTKKEDWPTLEAILDYKERVVARLRSIYDGIAEGKTLGNTGTSLTKRTARLLWMVKEHQELHMETLLYMLVQSPSTLPPPGFTTPDFAALAASWDATDARIGGAKARQALVKFETVEDVLLGHDDNDKADNQVVIDPAVSTRRAGETEDAWIARLNKALGDPEFGWDNETPARKVPTGKYSIRATPITNEEYLDFFNSLKSSEARVAALPPSWALAGGVKQAERALRATDVSVRSVYGAIPFAQSHLWPVQASGAQLAQFAASVGGRLPTQAELLRFWDHERVQLSQRPESRAWNTAAILAGKNVGLKNWHPVPAVPTDASEGRVPHNGGVFEWTSTEFANYDGFSPSELYPAYSVDFFDGKHRVVLGGSWATTPVIASRRSFTNEYQEPYGMIFGGARVAFDL